METLFSKKTYLALTILLISISINAEKIKLVSPNGNNSVVINSVNEQIELSLFSKNTKMLSTVNIGIKTNFDKKKNYKIIKTNKGDVNRFVYPILKVKNNKIEDIYKYVQIFYENKKCLEIRLFNNGIAWQWKINYNGEFNILNEKIEFELDENFHIWNNNEKSYHSENQCIYTKDSFYSLKDSTLFSVPLLFENKTYKIAFFESGLQDYAGLWFRKSGKNTIQADLPHYPKELYSKNYFSENVISTEKYISKHIGRTEFPWRIITITREDKDLLRNQLVYQLATPPTGDYSWIQPGKVAWEWLTGANIIGVNFKAGVNTETYKYYIDFAKKYNLEYILLDGGWFNRKKGILTPKTELNVEEVCNYAKLQGVKVLIWAPALLLRENTLNI